MKQTNRGVEIQELLKPRYKVISKYPGSEDWEEIDAIITLPDSRYKYADRKGTICGVELFDSYPNIYERLAWWEERKESEMPDYVKYDAEVKGVMKVIKWHIDEDDVWFDADGNPNGFSTVYTEPATKEEYESYLTSLKEK